MDFSAVNLPPIRPSSNRSLIGEKRLIEKTDANNYEQWRANIHQQLEDDLCRQVEKVIEESERQERLSKLRRQYMRVGQRHNLANDLTPRNADPWGEIERRNQLLLHPINTKNSSFLTRSNQNFNHCRGKFSNQNFNIEALPNYSRRKNSLNHPDENASNLDRNLDNPEQSEKNYSFIFGNSIIKSNKANILTIFENNSALQSYVNKYGVVISEDGPFWPRDYRILHPTPRLLTRELTPKEFYLNVTEGSSQQKNGFRQTFDNQPALQKFTDPFKHPTIVYDMEKSARQQQPKNSESEQTCPTLIFESRFEGGNLRQARRVGQFEYELILRPDLYTRRHTQWYYFRVQNMIANTTYRFRIINLVKKSSLYKEGMRILVFSEIDARKEIRGWYRSGHHINYSEYQPKNYNSLLERDINYYELDFQLEFNHSGDTCYIAHCYPYTFTDLKEDLDRLSSIRSKEIFRRETLCESQAGNTCYMITVTDETVPIEQKKFVFITARIHPGETNSSYMMRGLLEFITSDDRVARQLRSQLIFKIVPMLNPDGVIIGNYRCSLTGKDMNRNFRHPRKQTFPTIYHIKEMMQSLKRDNHEILAFCDLHGHSRKSNVFAYGCDGCDGPLPDMKNFLNARVLPYIMSRMAPDMFAFDFCKFHIHRCKESTGRVVMWKEMDIKNSFTLEASFAGSSIVDKPCHFSIQDYEKFGQHICESLRQYLNVLSDASRLDSIFMDITRCVLRKLGKEKLSMLNMPTNSKEDQNDQPNLSISSVSNCLQLLTQCHAKINEQEAINSSSDSDSDPEGGEIPEFNFHKEETINKKKSKKSRSEKTVEERVEKLNRKREISRAQAPKANTSTTTEETSNVTQRRTRVSHTLTTDNETNASVKAISTGTASAAPPSTNNLLNASISNEQMDKASRSLPNRGHLFVSKYANRSGHGLPIFTTERAIERRQKRFGSLYPDGISNDDDSDDEADNLPIRERVRDDNSLPIEKDSTTTAQATAMKRTASLISLTLKDLPHVFNENSIQASVGTNGSPSLMFKTSTQRRLQRFSRRHQQLTLPDNKSTLRAEKETKQSSTLNSSTMPPLMEVSLHTPTLHNLQTTADIDSSGRYAYDTNVDSYGVNHHRLYTIPDTIYRTLSRAESPPIRTNASSVGVHIPIIGGNRDNLLSRSASFAATTPNGQQTLPSIDAVLRERSLIIASESMPQLNPMDRVHQALRQLYVPNEKR